MVIRKKKGKTGICLMAGVVIAATSVATTGAYLTYGTPGLHNVLTSGNVSVEVKEPDWQEKSGEAMLPGESRRKNPLVKNTGTLESWVFLEVNVPIRKVTLVDDTTQRKQTETEMELFRFQSNAGWELIEHGRQRDNMQYVYGWKEPLMPTQQTGTLFDSITIVPYLEGSLNEQEVQQLTIAAHAVQKNIAPAETGLKELYQIYQNNQN